MHVSVESYKVIIIILIDYLLIIDKYACCISYGQLTSVLEGIVKTLVMTVDSERVPPVGPATV
jgi:hypothetical protein